jgi:hypothetical protein
MILTRFRGWLGAGALLVLAGCGGDDRAAPLGREGAKGGTGGIGASGGLGGGGTGATAGTSGEAGASGGAAGSGGAGPGAPSVRITSPEPVSDPSQDGVLIGDRVTAICSAVAASGGRAVSASSVKLELLDEAGAVLEELPGTPGEPDHYSASFVLTAVPNGPISLRCLASDVSTPPQTATDTISTFVDHGPEIRVTSPAAASVHPLAGAVPFAFEVLPAPLAAGDTRAAVADVKLDVRTRARPRATC